MEQKNQYNKEEKQLSQWIQTQKLSGIPEYILPANISQRGLDSKPKNFPILSKTFGSPPELPDRDFTQVELQALERNRLQVQRFRWNRDIEFDAEMQRQQILRDQLYQQGFRWWEINQGMRLPSPRRHNEFEARIIEEEKFEYHQSWWEDEDWKHLYDHATSKNAVSQTQW